MVRNCLLCKTDFHAPDRSVHKFPKSPKLRGRWLDALGLKERGFNKNYTYLCSGHFSENDFCVNSLGVRHLRTGAVPTVTSRMQLDTERRDKFTSEDSINVVVPQIELDRGLGSITFPMKIEKEAVDSTVLKRESVTNETSITEPSSSSITFTASETQKLDESETIKRKHRLAYHYSSRQDASKATTYDCRFCSYKTKLKKNLTRHMWIHKDGSEVATYQCELCPYKTNRKGHMSRHALIHKDASEVPTYQCKRCPYKTKRKDNLFSHVLLRHQDAPDATTFERKFCPDKANLEEDFMRRVVIRGDASKRTIYLCKLCAFRTIQREHLYRHVKVHKDACKKAGNPKGGKLTRDVRVHRCKLCPYKSKLLHNLKRHQLTHQDPSETTIYQCELCDFKTRDKYYVPSHMLVHQGATYSCEFCPYKAKRKRYLTRHVSVHHDVSKDTETTQNPQKIVTVFKKLEGGLGIKSEELYIKEERDECDRNGNNTLSLIDPSVTPSGDIEIKPFIVKSCNPETIHTTPESASDQNAEHPKDRECIDDEQVKTYPCKLCFYEAKQKCHLTRHMFTHRDESETPIYRCDFCPYKAKQKRYLTSHMLNHQPNGTYACEHCSYETRRRRNLRRHMAIHRDISKVTTYVCDLCPYKGKRMGDLSRHALTHQDMPEEPIYECELCPYKARRRGHLFRHMFIHQDLSEDTEFTRNQQKIVTERRELEGCLLIKPEELYIKVENDRNGDSSLSLIESSVMPTDDTEIKPFVNKSPNPEKNSVTLKSGPEQVVDPKGQKLLEDVMRGHLKGNTDQDASELTIYQCDLCPFKTTHKYYLSYHELSH